MGQITLNEEVAVGAKVDLNIVLEGIIPIKIPCLDIEGLHIGSCSYDGDALLASASDFLCPTYVPEGQECMLPLGPGSYGGGDPLVVVLPEIPGIIVDLLASGTYYADATVNYADGTQMTCIYIRIELTGSK